MSITDNRPSLGELMSRMSTGEPVRFANVSPNVVLSEPDQSPVSTQRFSGVTFDRQPPLGRIHRSIRNAVPPITPNMGMVPGLDPWRSGGYIRETSSINSMEESLRAAVAEISAAEDERFLGEISGTRYTAGAIPALETIRTGTGTGRAAELIRPERTEVFSDDVGYARVEPLTGNVENWAAAIGSIGDSNVVRMGSGIRNQISASYIKPKDVYEALTEASLIRFLKDKLSLKVTTQWAGKNIEVKVSLRLAETDEELVSDTDYVQINHEY